MFDIPASLLAGIAFNEFGGDPMWVDDIAYVVRQFDHSGDPYLESATVTKEADLTSFGNLSTQIKRAAESLGYDLNNLTSEQRESIKSSLKNPVQNIYIAAKHLSDLRNVDFSGKGASSLTIEDIRIIATRFNRGPNLSLEQIKKNTSYGNSVVNRIDKLNNLIR